MGCCRSSDSSETQKSFLQSFQEGVKLNSKDILLPLVTKVRNAPELKNLVETFNFSHLGMNLGPLAYCMWEGFFESFKVLVEEFGLSVAEMEKNLDYYSYNAVNLLCEKNSSDILEYYIPIYLQHSTIIYPSIYTDKTSLELGSSIASKKKTLNSVHVACEYGNISVLLIIFNYFKNRELVPDCFNLHYVDEITGENCVLIACRTANYTLLKFLMDVVKADFFVHNAKGEGAITVLLAANKKFMHRNVHDCLVYLVEVAGVNIIEQYEDALLLAQESSVVKYIEKILENAGIRKSKKEIEREFGIHERFVLEDEEVPKNTRFFKGMNLEDSNRTALSTISYVEITNDSLSILGKLN